jgi:PAS domain S-box-containing protein
MWKRFVEFTRPPVFPGNEEKTRQALALNALLMNMGSAMLLLAIPGLIFIFPEKIFSSIFEVIGIFVMITAMVLNKQGRTEIGGIFLLSSLWALTVFMLAVSGGIKSLDTIFFVSGTLIAGVVLGRKGTLFYAGVSILTGLVFTALDMAGVTFPRILAIPPASALIILGVNLAFTVIPLQVTLKSLVDSSSKVHASEERYRLISSIISDYVFSIQYDADGKITDEWLDGAFESITGYTNEEYLKRGGWKSLIHPDDMELDKRYFARLQANQKISGDIRIIRKNGDIKWVRAYVQPVWDDKNNRLAGINGAIQDITVQKETELSLRQRESILDAVAASAEILFKAPNWKTEINNMLERLGKSINASHAYIFENQEMENGRVFTTMSFEWSAPGIPSDLETNKYAGMVVAEDDLSSWYENMSSGLSYIGDKNHVSEADYDYLLAKNILALLDVPIYVNGKWWGCIGFDDITQARTWTNAEVDALKIAANVLGGVVKRQMDDTFLQNELQNRKMLIAELELRNAESETLRESAAIVAATLEQSETIKLILEQMARVVPYDSASVQLLVNEDTLEIVSSRGLKNKDGDVGIQFTVSENEPSYPVLKEEAPYILYEDIQMAFNTFNELPHNNIHAWMAVPLKSRDRVFGIIALDGQKVGQFSEKDAKLAVTYANQVAIALENARLFSNLQLELSTRQALIDELEDKNAELERFTYTVSHDLRSPLVTIRGFLGYLEKSASAGNMESFNKDMARIVNATNRMDSLLKDLLELSRIGRVINEPHHVPFEEIVRDAMEIVYGRFEKRGITLHIQPNLPIVHVDRPRLTEVLQNLLDNAAKYMGDQQEPRVEIGTNGMDPYGNPVFFVRDNGMGIDPEYHDRIFGLFNKLDPASEGTGIGLSLVKRIIEFHGGEIWVESSVGQGSTFYFTLKHHL